MVAHLDPPRLETAKGVVLKIGSALLVDAEAGLREAWLASVAEDVAGLRAGGARVAIVSSGAIALGRRLLDLSLGDLPLEQAQAAASVGQIALSRAYAEALGAHGLRAAQVLLTLGDTQNRRSYLNSCATLTTLLDLGVVPIVNENDTVATDEIRYGDNDRLAARAALMVGADRLALLSDVDGLYTANPKRDPAARHLAVVPEITGEIEAMAGGAGTPGAKGGMITKITAAHTATAGGCAVAIADGRRANPVAAIAEGARCTWFLAADTPQRARKRWIAGMKSLGALRLDAGAVAALRRGRSLLPAGVSQVSGAFGRGDPVALEGPQGEGVGAGLVRYSAQEARAIAGRRSGEIAEILGYPGRAAMVHRDDLVVWE